VLPDSEVNVGGGQTFHGSAGSVVMAVGLIVAVAADAVLAIRARRHRS